MAIPTANLPAANSIITDGNVQRRIYAAAFQTKLRQSYKLVPLCNREYEEMFQTTNLIQIPRDKEVVSITDPWVGNTYPAVTQTADLEARVLRMGNKMYTGVSIDPEQNMVVTPDLLTNRADNKAYAVAGVLDDDVAAKWDATNLGAVTQDFAVGSSTNISQVKTVGTATNYLQTDSTDAKYGTFTGTGADDQSILFETLWKLTLELADGAYPKIGPGAATIYPWTYVTSPVGFWQIRNYLGNKDTGDSRLFFEILEGENRGRLFGWLDVIQSNNLNEITVGGKKHVATYLANNAATAYAERHKVEKQIGVQENQLGDDIRIHSSMRRVVDTVDERFLYRIQIRTEA